MEGFVVPVLFITYQEDCGIIHTKKEEGFMGSNATIDKQKKENRILTSQAWCFIKYKYNFVACRFDLNTLLKFEHYILQNIKGQDFEEGIKVLSQKKIILSRAYKKNEKWKDLW
jgi:Holliday junction resolvase-like predicted endonuclease